LSIKLLIEANDQQINTLYLNNLGISYFQSGLW